MTFQTFEDMTPYFPTCAVCGRKVSRMVQMQDVTSRHMVFVVECHGETEETRIAYTDFMDMPGGDIRNHIRGGTAFATPKLAVPMPRLAPAPDPYCQAEKPLGSA
jgi:hypothetical protein